MHQNTQICKLNFINFLGAMPPDYHTGEELRRPSPDPNPSALWRFAPTAPRSGPSAPLSSTQPEILDPPLGAPTLWKSWLRLCALTICRIDRKLGSSLPKKLGARPQPHPPHRNPGSATVVRYTSVSSDDCRVRYKANHCMFRHFVCCSFASFKVNIPL